MRYGSFAGLHLVLFLAFSSLPTTLSYAVERAFEFSGEVDLNLSPPFGIGVPPGTPVSGGFLYDSNSPATHISSDPNCDCTGYAQNHINGFWADFGGNVVTADSYLIEIGNDRPFSPNPGESQLADIVTIRYFSADIPPPPTPLIVNGNPESEGLFSLTFVGPNTLFSDSTLPTNLSSNDFPPFPSTHSLVSDLTIFLGIIFSTTDWSAASTLNSDHNLDGTVDGNDFLIWQRHQGAAVQNGDSNSDFIVDGTDLSAWQDQYGDGVLEGLLVAVPEPSTLGLFLVTCFALSGLSRLENRPSQCLR